jgi:methylenetetrahydrofolate--tRNA-(uracil-5-)-methyltransferase
MAKRGEKTLLFGPLKPVGLVNPYTGKEAYAVVQLRQDNKEGTLYNLVGFQTHLKWGEQKRVFGMIPGLESAEFVRYGVMHRNTYINSPKLLTPSYALRTRSNIFFAGQITGVEGYIESASSGLVAGINAAKKLLGEEPLYFPRETAHGAISHYISECVGDFQPMNINFGIIPPLTERIRDKRLKNRKISERAVEIIKKTVAVNN